MVGMFLAFIRTLMYLSRLFVPFYTPYRICKFHLLHILIDSWLYDFFTLIFCVSANCSLLMKWHLLMNNDVKYFSMVLLVILYFWKVSGQILFLLYWVFCFTVVNVFFSIKTLIMFITLIWFLYNFCIFWIKSLHQTYVLGIEYFLSICRLSAYFCWCLFLESYIQFWSFLI